LEYLRKSAGQSVIIKVFLGIIVLVFMFFGVGTFGSQVEWAATVNDEIISKVEFDRAYTNIERIYRSSAPNNRPLPEVIRSQALDQLINTELLVQEATHLGLQVGEQELRESIGAIPDFQIEGQPNKERYLEVLRLNQLKPIDFEETQQRQLLADKVLSVVRAGIHVSDAEVKQRFHYENDRSSLRFIRIKRADFRDQVTIEEADLEKFYETERESFREPERVEFRYLIFRPEDYEQQVVPTDDQIQIYYDEHRSEYERPEEIRARHILFKISPGSTDEEKAEIRARADAVAQRARDGEDFAQLATENSEDSTAAEGGDLGFFRRGVMTPPFEEAAFALEPGEISDIVESQFGLHIIEVEERSPAGQRTLEEAREEIVGVLQKRGARKLALQRVEAAFDTVLDGATLDNIAAEFDKTIESTDPFARGEVIPGLGRRPEINEFAFASDVGEISEIMGLDSAYLIFALNQRIESHIPELAAIRDQVETRLRDERAREAARVRAEELLEALRIDPDIEALAEREGLTTEETGEIGRFGGYIPKLGNLPDLKSSAFNLTAEKPLADAVFDASGDTVVAVLIAFVAADEGRFETEKDNLIQRTRAQREAGTIAEFLTYLRSNADIRVRVSTAS
jgi:peptidyl-prolyl cis-trans isomerase D